MSAPAPGRRALFGGAVALLGAATGLPAMADAATTHPDAELIAAAARFQQAFAEYRRLNKIESSIEQTEADLMDPTPAMAAATAALEAHADGEYEAALDALFTAPNPTSPEGLTAVAETVWAFYEPDPPDRHRMGAMLWLVICAVAGRPMSEAGA